MRNGKLRAGDLVELRSAEEILATLDGDGKFDGLPFMPEMLAWSGKTFRVSRRVEKTCMEVDGHYPTRQFASRDVRLGEQRVGRRRDRAGRVGRAMLVATN